MTIIHGRPSTYNNHKCRCVECKAAWAKYQAPRVKAWRDKRKKNPKKTTPIEVRF